MDFKVRWMRQHPDGWYYALLLDLHTQNEVEAHDRWGSWMIGSPKDPGGTRRECLPIVAAGLQAFKSREQSRIKKIDPESQATNPFLPKSKRKPAPEKNENPFLKLKKRKRPGQKTEKTNPFMKKKST